LGLGIRGGFRDQGAELVRLGVCKVGGVGSSSHMQILNFQMFWHSGLQKNMNAREESSTRILQQKEEERNTNVQAKCRLWLKRIIKGQQ